ncbi:MAG: hypothetical protein WAU10_21665, partial [Caldilineaceae bacterium]
MPTTHSSHPALALFSQLLVAAPSGREEGIAALVRAKLDEICVAHQTDGAGNVLVRLAGRAGDSPLTCYAAHLDEIGMVVTRIEANGDLRVDRSGGLHPWKLGEGPVEIVGDREQPVIGVLSFGSTHGGSLGEKAIGWGDCRVITGLTPAQLKA